jgi:hypothetical protein
MGRFKDFGAGTSTGTKDPLSFKLHGEEFHCVPEVQGKVLLDLVAKSGSEDDPVAAAEVITFFFKTVLHDDSYEKFEALLSSKDKIVSMETLAEITTWLVEEYTGRPEEQPEVS